MTVGVSMNLTDLDCEFLVETDEVRVMMDLVLRLNSGGGMGFVTEEEVEASDSDTDSDVKEGMDVKDGTRRLLILRSLALVLPSTGILRSAFERGRMMFDQKVCSGEVSGILSTGGNLGRR
jgi:hypothetical protein